jgi:UDP-N-acetylglucosamine transferase subunit ALG13
MIFATVGTTDRPFDRLIAELDRIAPDLDHEVTAQIGAATVEPEHVEWFRFTDKEVIERLYAEADIVVGHAGAGTVLTSLINETPIVVVPRRKDRDEHTTEHQFDLADAIESRTGVFVVREIEGLREAVDAADQVELGDVERDRSLESFLTEYVGARA